jgi:hypothetical protein
VPSTLTKWNASIPDMSEYFSWPMCFGTLRGVSVVRGCGPNFHLKSFYLQDCLIIPSQFYA